MVHRVQLLSLLFTAGLAFAADAPPASAPATTQAVQDVEVAITKIDPAPTRVTGKLNDVSPADLFFKLAQQANVAIVPSDEGLWDDPTLQNAAFSADWENQPLWDAVNEACEAMGLKPTIEAPSSGLPRIKLERAKGKPLAAVDGTAMVRPQRVVRSASVSSVDGKRQPDTVRLSFAILLEPKLRKYAFAEPAVIDKAEDEQGKAIATTQPTDSSAGARYGEPSIAYFAYPTGNGPKPGAKFAVVRGTIPLQVVKEIAVITFNDPFANPRELKTKVGPHTLTLEKPTGDPQSGYNVRLKLERGDLPKEGAPPDQKDPRADLRWTATSQPLGQFGAYIAMVGPKGETTQNGGSAGWSDKEAHTEIHFSAREAGDQPTALRVELPVSFQAAQAKFEFKDLPLP